MEGRNDTGANERHPDSSNAPLPQQHSELQDEASLPPASLYLCGQGNNGQLGLRVRGRYNKIC